MFFSSKLIKKDTKVAFTYLITLPPYLTTYTHARVVQPT